MKLDTFLMEPYPPRSPTSISGTATPAVHRAPEAGDLIDTIRR